MLGEQEEKVRSEFHGCTLRPYLFDQHQANEVFLLREATDGLQTKYPKPDAVISITYRDGQGRHGERTHVSPSLESPSWPLTVELNTTL